MASLITVMLFTTGGIPAWAQTAEITDSLGRSIVVPLPVDKLVVLPSDALEVVRLLGVTDKVVGVNNHIQSQPGFWPVLHKRPRVGLPFTPNYEQVFSLWPDLVLAYGNWPKPELEEKLRPLGIPVLRLDFYKLSSLNREVLDFGRLMQKEERAMAFTAWNDTCLSLLEQRLASQTDRPLVYLESYTNFRASGPGSGGFEMGVLAGGNLLSALFSISNPQISTEFIVEQNPDVIVKLASGINAYETDRPDSLKQIHEQIITRPGWSALKAVQAERVHVISSDLGPGPRGIISVLYMASFFYPDTFKNLDIMALHREYLERFQNVPYRGYYVYP